MILDLYFFINYICLIKSSFPEFLVQFFYAKQNIFFSNKSYTWILIIITPFIYIISKENTIFMTNNYDFLFKFIIIGDSSVGKSCLLLRFTEGRFKGDHEPTLGVQFGSKNTVISDLTIKIQIWDTAGQESFKAITRSYYKGSIAAFLIYDITKRDSFDNLNKWLFEVKNHSHEKVQIVIVGNKTDLKNNREVSYEEGEKFAALHGFSFFETSAQSGEKVQQLFKTVAKKIVSKIETKQINPDSQSSYGLRRGKKHRKEQQSSTKLQTPLSEQNSIKKQKEGCCSK